MTTGRQSEHSNKQPVSPGAGRGSANDAQPGTKPLRDLKKFWKVDDDKSSPDRQIQEAKVVSPRRKKHNLL